MRAAFAATLIVGSAIGLSACASTSSARVPSESSFAEPELRRLARRAQAGDKNTQLELGIRFEEGRGVPQDLGRAETLYRLAASDGARFAYLHSPSIGHGQPGQLLALRRAPELGLLEAKQKLARLRSRIEGDRNMSK